MQSLPVIDMSRWERGSSERKALADALGDAFGRLGFAQLQGHAVDARLTEPAFEAARAFFHLPAEVKQRYHQQGGGGARGYTPFGREQAKDAQVPDLKEFWHVGRELDEGSPLAERLPPNVWPREVPAFREAMLALYGALEDLGERVLRALALHLGLEENWFDPHVALGNSILRPIHYPPLPDAEVQGVRSAAHEDINLITLLVAADQPGLEIRTRSGQWLAVEAAPGAIVCNVGDMLQRLTNHCLVSTTHRVINPHGDGARRSRFALPFFLHPRGDMEIASLPSCVTPENPDRYPEAISADDYLKQRLREIGLL